MSLNNLADRLPSWYEQLWEIQDLDEAIVLVQEALDLRSQGHADRSESVGNLALHLCNRFTQSQELQDKEEVVQSLHSARVCAPNCIFSTARTWICMVEHFQHPTILFAYETSL